MFYLFKEGELMDVIKAIQDVGFNIVFILLMAYFLKYVFDRLQNTIDKFTEAITENTLSMEKVLEKLENHTVVKE